MPGLAGKCCRSLTHLLNDDNPTPRNIGQSYSITTDRARHLRPLTGRIELLSESERHQSHMTASQITSDALEDKYTRTGRGEGYWWDVNMFVDSMSNYSRRATLPSFMVFSIHFLSPFLSFTHPSMSSVLENRGSLPWRSSWSSVHASALPTLNTRRRYLRQTTCSQASDFPFNPDPHTVIPKVKQGVINI